MATDDERREVAERLRGIKTTREGCGHDLCCDLWEAVYDSDHECDEMCDECEIAVLDSLADLIEPGESGQNRDKNRDTVQIESPAVQIAPECDRDALLALASGLEADADRILRAARNARFGGGPSMGEAKHDAYEWRSIARRIREALGVTDHADA